MYDKNFESRMRVLFRPLETALKGVKAVKLCNTRCVEIVEETSSKGLDARMPCPRKDRAMVIKGATVMEDRGIPPKKGLTTK